MIIVRRKADYLILYTSEMAALVGINNVLVSLPTLEPHVAHSYFSYFRDAYAYSNLCLYAPVVARQHP